MHNNPLPLARAKSCINGAWLQGYQYIFVNGTGKVGDVRLYMPAERTATAIYADKEQRYICKINNCLYEQADLNTFSLCSNHNDRNGKAIFAGDIISNEWCFDDDYSVVCFGEYKTSNMTEHFPQGHYGFFVQSLSTSTGFRNQKRKDLLYYAQNCEVIGNIYDNPQLCEWLHEETE